MRTIAWGLLLCVPAAMAAGFVLAPEANVAFVPAYHYGWQSQRTYDVAYEQAPNVTFDHAVAGLVAHHLLVADKIAEVFNGLANDDVRTVVIVSPNHFSNGLSPMQTAVGGYATPYGDVAIDEAAVNTLLNAVPELRKEEFAFMAEHGIAALTPFLRRSFPRAKLVPIILDESLDAEAAWNLGDAIARELPGALLIASVDMTHYRDAAFTAANDAAVMTQLEHGVTCVASHCNFSYDIDSNASLRTLFAFAAARGASAWTMTHHGSSLDMGATNDPAENTSHILGYFSASN